MENAAALRSRIGRTAVARIRDLTDAADACIVGTVRANRFLFSPGRTAPCIAYRFRDSTGHEEHRAVPFVLEDDTGRALIDPSRAILLVAAREGEGLHRSFVGGRYLCNHGRAGSYREQCVEIGQRIYVIGSCTRELDVAASGGPLYRDQPVSRLRFVHRDTQPVVLADRL